MSEPLSTASDCQAKLETRRILLVGGAGYIGIPLATHLAGAGARIRILDQLVYGNGAPLLGPVADHTVEYHYGDMGDQAAVEQALDGVTDVILLGGLVGDPITKKFPQQSQAINEAGIRRCIKYLNGRGLQRVIFVSTCSNYGLIGPNDFAGEDFALNPLSLYAKAKVAAEQHLLGLHGQVDYDATVLRFATAFGLAPRMRFDLTVNEFTRDLFLGRELIVYDADTWRPYCHVRDFARLILRVLAAPAEAVRWEVFNAGGDGNNLTKRQIVELVLQHVPQGRVVYRDKGVDPRNYRVNFRKVREALAFEPAFDVSYGVREIIDALQAHLLDDVDLRPTFYGNYELTGLSDAG